MIAVASGAFNCFRVIIVRALNPKVGNRTVFWVAFQDNRESAQASFSHVDVCVVEAWDREPIGMTYINNETCLYKWRSNFGFQEELPGSMQTWKPLLSGDSLNIFTQSPVSSIVPFTSNLNFTFSIFIFFLLASSLFWLSSFIIKYHTDASLGEKRQHPTCLAVCAWIE